MPRPLALPALLLTAALLSACASQPNDLASPGAGMVQLGNQMVERGEDAAALDFYRRALDRDPQNVPAHKGIATILEKMGDTSGAGEHFREVATLRPDDADAQRGFGRLLMAEGDYEGAKKAFEAALDENSDDARAMTGLGVALDKLGEHEKAQKKFEKALKIDPQNLAALNNLAYAKIQQGRPQDAIKLLEPHWKNPKATPSLRQNLAMAYGLMGMELDAARVAKMDLAPENVRKNLAFYKNKREEFGTATGPYAVIGTYATEALAMAEIPALMMEAKKAGVALTPKIHPSLATEGGTPTFELRLTSQTDPEAPAIFCMQRRDQGKRCGVRGD